MPLIKCVLPTAQSQNSLFRSPIYLDIGSAFWWRGFRLFPYSLIAHMTRKLLASGLPVVLYLHPREIDPSHPRLKMNAVRTFKSYVNLSSTENKLRRLLKELEFVPMEKYLNDHILEAVQKP